MTTLTGNDVWNATIADPAFADEMPVGSPIRDAIRPFIEGSVVALDVHLGDNVSLQVITTCKMKFLRYCLENNFGAVIGEVMEMEADIFTGLFEQLLDMLESMTKDVSTFLSENGVTEEQVMRSSQVGLNPTMLAQWEAGTLTVTDILRFQPSVILKNSN